MKITLSDRGDKIKVAILKKSDLFGEMFLFNDTLRSSTAIENVKLAYLNDLKQLTNLLELNLKLISFSFKSNYKPSIL